ncbi:efflux RND transporter permease subunit [Pseudomonas veronii]
MAHDKVAVQGKTVVKNLADFDHKSGALLERVIFNNRLIVVLICALITLVLGYQATKLELNASFEKMIPTGHPFIVNYLEHKDQLSGLGNAVQIAVENRSGTIYDAEYMAVLEKLSAEIFLVPGVDRTFMKSLWTPNTQWSGVTEEGLDGGPVIPNGYTGSDADLQQLEANIDRSGEVGRLVALNAQSSVIYVPLLSAYPDGSALNYAELSDTLEKLRDKYQSDEIRIRITGFAKVVGDLIDGLQQVLLFFAAAIAICGLLLYWYTRCMRSTLLVMFCSLIAVVWLFGLLPTLGYGLDPYSILVPFVVFAIGMSHGAQKMNGIMQAIGRGTHKLVAARFTFRRLFLTGMVALITDAFGFAVLMVIDIPVIRDLAIAASIGVAVLIFSNLILLPILLSFTGVGAKAALRSLRSEQADLAGTDKHPLWRFLDRFTERRWAGLALLGAICLAVVGAFIGNQLKIGDLDPGAPELRSDSRYNRDVSFLNDNYGASSDVFAIMVKTPEGACSQYETLMKVDALEWQLRQLPGVESVNTLALLNRWASMGLNEGDFRWYELLKNQSMLNSVTASAPRGLYNDYCNLLTVYAYLSDHKAETLSSVVEHVEAFAKANDSEDVQFLMAAGSAGIEAATNIVVEKANDQMLLLVYAVVIALAYLTFRSWQAVVCAVVPLMITSLLCEALMVWMNIGVKVATLPVIALGVGIGVDYALYILSVTLARMREGLSLSEAYYRALVSTGKVVILTGVTLSMAVATWYWSPIKFQADMGILLAFMFLWNMIGALILLPALACFLLPDPNKGREAVPAASSESQMRENSSKSENEEGRRQAAACHE